jgi:hypothetical protein
MADINIGVSEAILAAGRALLSVDVLVAKQLVQAETAYMLTREMIQQNQGALAIPLITLSVAAIGQGLVAYAAEQTSAELYSRSTAEQTQRAFENSQSVYQAAVSRLQRNR